MDILVAEDGSIPLYMLYHAEKILKAYALKEAFFEFTAPEDRRNDWGQILSQLEMFSRTD